MTSTIPAEDGAMRRAQVEAVLADYPNLQPEEIDLLLHWFRNEATALEVGLIASDPDLAKPYHRLKADHLERLSGADIVRAFIFVAVVAAIVFLIAWRAM